MGAQGWRITFVIASLVATGAMLGLVAWVARSRVRDSPGMLAFLGLTICIAWHCGFSAGQLMAPEPELVRQLQLIRLAGSTFWFTFWILFVAGYAGHSEWVRKSSTRAFVFAIPALFVVAVLTNPLHGAVLTDTPILDTAGRVVGFESGRLTWFNEGIMVGAVFFGFVVLFRFLREHSPAIRHQVLALSAAAMLPIAVGVLRTMIDPIAAYPVDVPTLPFSTAIMGFALFRWRFLDVVPVAYPQILEQIADGVLVLDAKRRVSGINRAARDILGLDESAFGRPIELVCERTASMLPEQGKTAQFESKIDEVRLYITISPLTSEQGRTMGEVITLHDITQRFAADEARGRFMHDLLAAQDLERQMIARELHDEVGQSLTSFLVQLRRLEAGIKESDRAQLEELEVRISQTITDMGRLARGLHPAALDEFGLYAALKRHIDDFERIHGVRIDVHVAGIDDNTPRLPAAFERALFRIVQEALTNIAKHAEADAASVIVTQSQERLCIIVEDNGVGFGQSQNGNGNGNGKERDGLGLRGIGERVSILQGVFTVESSEGEGTTLYVDIPIPQDSVQETRAQRKAH